MKPSAISADELFEDRSAILHWQWIAGRNARERRFDEEAVREARSGADLVGHLNYIHPYRVQIVGARELNYLMRGTAEDCARRVARIVTLQPPALVMCDGQTAPAALVTLCDQARIPLFATGQPAGFVVDVLRSYLSRHFADRITTH